jgi:superfamily II DNA or RNA helicase
MSESENVQESQFGICIDDGNNFDTSELSLEENKNYAVLFDWQRRALDYFFENKGIAIFQVVTGGGKSRFAIELIKKIWETEPDLRVLIVVPKNIILESTWQKELYNNGISLRDIGLYYGACKEYGKVTVTNMQNIQNIAMELFKGSVAIFDEVHNMGTERLLPFIHGDFKYKIGLSATLERMDEKHFDIIKIFNYNVFNYKPDEALSEGILNPFRFVNIGVRMDAVNFEKYTALSEELNQLLTMGGGFRRIMAMGECAMKNKMFGLITERKELVNNYYRKFEALNDIAKNHMKDKVLAFNEYNSQTSKCYWYLLEIGIKAKIIHSGISQVEREQVLMDFKKDRFNFLLATRILDEGYNLPKIDTAIIMSGNSTSRQTIQRMGRVLRKKKKESTLYQIYCKDTIEEVYADKRAKIFKELCSSYDEKLI